MTENSVITDEPSGLDKIVLVTELGTTAEVFLHGAHVTSFKPAGGQEVIFVSDKAIFKPPKAIRGGVPVCWPQFNDMGPSMSHGFARNTAFTLSEVSSSSAVLLLSSSPATRESFPHDWTFEVQVAVSDEPTGGKLSQSIRVCNTGTSSMATTQALHTYYAVSDISKTRVTGLEGSTWHDNTAARVLVPAETTAITFTGETDRIYRDTGDTIEVHDDAGKRKIIITKSGFSDAVVWNPWAAKAAALADFGDDEYLRMLCVEPANAACYLDGRSVEVPAGDTWEATQSITVEQA